MSTRLSVKTTSNDIIYKVKCVDDAQHVVKYSLNGDLISYEHDIEAENVTEFLGGNSSECAKARLVHESALEYVSYLSGESEPAGMISLDGDRWINREASCNKCDRGRSFTHFISLEHLLDVRNVGYGLRQANSVVKRISSSPNFNHVHISTLDEAVTALGMELDVNRSNIGGAGWLNPLVKHRFLTVPFLSEVKDFIRECNQVDYLFFLRDSFTREWLSSFKRNLTKSAAKVVFNDPELMRKISKARNKDPELVAEYVNRGIYSHIYTYIQEHVSPDDALLIFKKHPEVRSAKELLARNEPVSTAVYRLQAN